MGELALAGGPFGIARSPIAVPGRSDSVIFLPSRIKIGPRSRFGGSEARSAPAEVRSETREDFENFRDRASVEVRRDRVALGTRRGSIRDPFGL